ncbi:hypothetical protein [Corallococcus sp. EGB]|uniref:immunity protein Imm33 domain-containing protein n=1 Tax=Corallococcus sp. EGB TaxID=1521117 RepID=UPI001CBACBC6|nr:hypothetical protein [Corallococcus sp. EGB]
MNKIDRREQIAVCDQYGAEFVDSPENMKIGIADNVKSGLLPINGLRHPIENGTAGWYIWAGKGDIPQDDPDFFKPMHVAHLPRICPGIVRFLGLAPGWRFLVAGDYQDVWFDPALLKI